MARSEDAVDPSTGLDEVMSEFFREHNRGLPVGGGGAFGIGWGAAAHDSSVGNTMRDLYQKQWNDTIRDLMQRAMAGDEAAGAQLAWMDKIGPAPGQFAMKNPLTAKGGMYGMGLTALYDMLAGISNNRSPITPDVYGGLLGQGQFGGNDGWFHPGEGMPRGWTRETSSGMGQGDKFDQPPPWLKPGGGGLPGGGGPGGPGGTFPGYPGGGGNVALTGPQMNPGMPPMGGGGPRPGPGGGGNDMMQQLMAMIMQGGMQGGM